MFCIFHICTILNFRSRTVVAPQAGSEFKCNHKHTGKEQFGQYMKDLDAIMFMISATIIVIRMMMFSGNSSECRLEVSAATLADHGTWTCSLSQDKVKMIIVIMMIIEHR